MSEFYNNSIFWVEVDRISPNPYQPRKEFNDEKIAELADSIRQYGVLQPLVVTRKETEREDGGIAVEYELIAGERRLRASKLAMLPQVPVIIRAQEETGKMKLELAIIENLQREDLNAIDRALAFKQLVDEFNLKHIEIAKKVGKSREYVSNTLRLLGLPEHIQSAIVGRLISEGHARPLLMLGDDRAQERETLFEEIKEKKLTVRESERIARRIATDKARKQDLSPELIGIEKELTETLGTRVQIEQRSKKGGKVHIDYFSEEDLKRLLDLLAQERAKAPVEDVAVAASVAPVVAAADAALDNFNNTFTTKKDTQTTKQVQATPFKDFEIDTNLDLDNEFKYEEIKEVEEVEDVFAQLPPLPPLADTTKANDINTDKPRVYKNPFAEESKEQQQTDITKNPFADLQPLPDVIQHTPKVATNPFLVDATNVVGSNTEPAAPKQPINPFADLPTPQTNQVKTQASQSVHSQDDDDDLYSIKNFSL